MYILNIILQRKILHYRCLRRSCLQNYKKRSLSDEGREPFTSNRKMLSKYKVCVYMGARDTVNKSQHVSMRAYV